MSGIVGTNAGRGYGSIGTASAGPTVSASDPTVSTNAALGTQWANSTTGNFYILTDDTAGENVWTNTGSGSADVVPYVVQGSSYGYCAGGYSWTAPIAGQNYIDRFSFASGTQNSATVGTMAVLNATGIYTAPFGPASTSSSSYGYASGGYWDPGGNNSCEKCQLVATANSTDIGDLVEGKNTGLGWGNSVYHYTAGGDSVTPPALTDMIESIAYSSDAHADTTVNLIAPRSRGNEFQTLTYGYSVGGRETTTATAVNIIDRYPLATMYAGADVGDLDAAQRESGFAVSSTTYGYSCGGTTAVAATKINIIYKCQLVATASGVDHGDIGGTWYNFGSSYATTSGYGFGHEASSSTGSNIITELVYASDTTTHDNGDLTQARMGSAGWQI